eukprot:Gb_17068 [translate_table: standard]
MQHGEKANAGTQRANSALARRCKEMVVAWLKDLWLCLTDECSNSCIKCLIDRAFEGAKASPRSREEGAVAEGAEFLQRFMADMDSEIQMLKGQVKGLHELLPRTEAVTSQDESAEILLPEQSHGSDLCIYLLGGNDGNSWLGALDMYSPTTDIIRSLEPMPTARSYAAATVLDGNIYIFGGGNGVLWYNSVEQYNPTSDYWTSCPSMTLERGSLAGASLENKIFAFGGGNGVEYFSEVEMYDPLLGKWLLYGSMLQKVRTAFNI